MLFKSKEKNFPRFQGEYIELEIPDFDEMEYLNLDELKKVNKVTGVYLLFNGAELIYVGKAKDICARVRHHRSIHAGNKIFDGIYYFATKYLWEQKLLESAYNEMYSPKYKGNVLGDKIWRKDAFSLEEPSDFYRDSTKKEIIRQGARILRPHEYKQLLNGVLKDDHRIIFEAIFLTE